MATAEADAEAFGTFALAEVDAYTYVSEGEPGTPGEFIPHPGSVDLGGNDPGFVLGPITPSGAPASITSILTGNGVDIPPDVDDVTGQGNLEPLSTPPEGTAPGPSTPDGPLPQPLLSITDITWINPTATATPGIFEYNNQDPIIVNFGDRELDVDSDGLTGQGPLTLTIPAGTLFFVELSGSNINVEFETFVDGNNGFFTYDDTADPGGPVNYELTAFDFEAQDAGLGISDWDFQAASDFGFQIPPIPGTPGEAFAYAESTSAVDLEII